MEDIMTCQSEYEIEDLVINNKYKNIEDKNK